MAKKAYFIGIAGKTMAPLAKAFRDMGWEVSGSDHQGIYPPMSTYLKENYLPYTKGYRAENVPKDADLIVIGRSATMVDLDNPELTQAKKLGLLIMSFPEVFQQYLVKENSIVVAGSYGKTTTTAIITWILTGAQKDPSFMLSDIPLNFPDGTKITNSQYSVTEGDECPALGPCDLPKFMYYQPKYLLLTATIWDHPEVYKSEEQYLKAFIELVKLLPKDGLLVYELENVRPEVVGSCSSRKISYSFDSIKADCYVKDYSIENGKTRFTISFKNQEIDLETILIGKHNLQNICGAVTVALELGIDPETIKEALKTFKGVKSRLELLGKFGGRYLFSDIAQFQEKVKGSLLALRDFFPENRIICVFNPFATALKFRESLQWYSRVFDSANQVIVGKVSFLKEISKEQRVTGRDIVEAISQTQKNVFYEPVDKRLVEHLVGKTKEGEVIVFMSSGGLRFTNLIEETIRRLKDLPAGRQVNKLMDERYQKIISKLGEDRVLLDEPMASHTTFKIGGPADLFFVAETEEELIKAVKVAREAGVPYLILGGGSNLLVGDRGFRGMVIEIKNEKLKIKNENGKARVMAEAGAKVSVLLNKLAESGIAGLEFMAGIPGTVGGAIKGNGGAWQQNIGDKVLRVKVFFPDGKISWLTKDECQFDYRTSRFKKGGGEIVLAAEFGLSRGEPEEIKKKIQENLDKRSAQPKEPSAGSVFVNPKPQSAGEMIEQCGLKGAQVGGAKISEKHANFIVNVGKAKAADVVALMDLARAKVKEKFGVDLKEEIVRVGEF